MIRRTITVSSIALLILAAAFATLGGGVTASQQQSPSVAVEQGGACTEVSAFSSDNRTVEQFYGYTLDDDAPGVRFSANTPTGIETTNDEASSIFFYDGPEGLSLVVLHGAPNGTAGGAATYEFDGLPRSGEWVVKDDPSNESVEHWNRSGANQTVDWGWRDKYTDGGAFQGGLDGDFEVTIDAAFGEDANLDPLSSGNVSQWRALSSQGDSVEGYVLDQNQSITIRSGTCP